jgi:hypothetical protein
VYRRVILSLGPLIRTADFFAIFIFVHDVMEPLRLLCLFSSAAMRNRQEQTAVALTCFAVYSILNCDCTVKINCLICGISIANFFAILDLNLWHGILYDTKSYIICIASQ